MADESLQHKWDEIYRDAGPGAPAAVLRENQHLLPTQGTALDVACGMGGNGLLMARSGLDVQGWDISPVAMEKLQQVAVQQQLPLTAVERDVVSEPPEPGSFDVIAVSHFLDRDLAPTLVAALKPGGLLFYQTFTRARVDDSGPRNPAFRLQDGELLALFSALNLLVYREEGTVGDHSRGFRNEAFLVGQKPAT